MSKQPSPEQFLHSPLQVSETNILLTGEGHTTYDQLFHLVRHRRKMPIVVVGSNLSEEVCSLALKHGIRFLERAPESDDLDQAHVLICTGTNTENNRHLVHEAHQKGLFVHVTGVSALSDIYTPRQEERNEKFHELRWKKAATWILFAFLFMIVGHFSLYYVHAGELWDALVNNLDQLDTSFKWMVLTGFCAQLIDGLLGMGYGLTCTTVLLSLGIQLPAISGSIHTAEMFSSGISGYTHYKFGNINKKLFYALLIPGVTGAVLGAVLLSVYGDTYAAYIKPVLAVYTLLIGLRILLKAFRKKRERKKTKYVSLLAGAGGFLDSFGGGGWGPLVTSTLISGGRTPKYVIGSVSATEFFVTLVSALTFFTMIGIGYWQVIAGLVIGGSLAAPLAARLSGKLPVRFMFIGVGALAIVWSLKILIASIF